MKIIAKTKDGDIYEVRLQRDFPNCQKYTKCCIDDKPFWDKLSDKITATDKALREQKIPTDFYEPKYTWKGK